MTHGGTSIPEAVALALAAANETYGMAQPSSSGLPSVMAALSDGMDAPFRMPSSSGE